MLTAQTLDAAYLPVASFSVNPCSHPLYYRDVIHGVIAEARCFSCGMVVTPVIVDKYETESPETD